MRGLPKFRNILNRDSIFTTLKGDKQVQIAIATVEISK